MIDFLRRRATPRNVFLGFLVVVILAALINWIAVPAYRSASSGFVPFNLQNPLNVVMVAFERGALGPGSPTRYFRFILLEGLYGFAYMWFTILLWCWLGARAPNTIVDRLLSYGLPLLPVIGLALGIAESLLFLKLIVANPRDPQHDLTLLALNVHWAKYVTDIVVYAFSASYILTAIVAWLMTRGRGGAGTRSAT